MILTPTDMNGLEIEYRIAGDPWEEKHMAVRERRGPGPTQFAAIFGPLPAGVYEFRERGLHGAAQLVMTVGEASVNTELADCRRRTFVSLADLTPTC